MIADKSNNYAYNKALRNYANKLRKNMTKAEASLWKYILKSGKMEGVKFRRQRPILKYIVDFVCLELKLIIEIDGIIHDFEAVVKNDNIRKMELENAGFTLIRFQDREVLGNLEGVAESIALIINDLKAPPP